LNFFREIYAVWRRQAKAWRVVVVWMVVNRFLRRFVEQYATIYIRLLGASPVQLGATWSTASLAGMVVSVPLGMAQDRYSLRKIYLSGITLLTAVPLLYAVAPTWQWLIPVIILMGLGQRLGACSVICDVSLPNRDRATGKALCEGVGALPTVLAPALAALLITYMGGVSVGGIRTLYWLYFAVGLVPTYYAYRNLPEIARPTHLSGKPKIHAELGEAFRRGTAPKRYPAFVSLSHFTSMMLLTFMYPYSYEIGGATPFILGAISTAMTLAEVVFSTVFGRAADSLGRKRIFFTLAPLFVISNLVFIFAPHSFFLVAAGFLYGFRMIASVVYSAIGPELVPSSCLGRWRGIIGLLMGIAGMLASVAGGFIWEQLGPQYVFVAATAVDLLLIVPLLYSIPETLQRTEGRAHGVSS